MFHIIEQWRCEWDPGVWPAGPVHFPHGLGFGQAYCCLRPGKSFKMCGKSSWAQKEPEYAPDRCWLLIHLGGSLRRGNPSPPSPPLTPPALSLGQLIELHEICNQPIWKDLGKKVNMSSSGTLLQKKPIPGRVWPLTREKEVNPFLLNMNFVVRIM
jgi:hypothetical protein